VDLKEIETLKAQAAEALNRNPRGALEHYARLEDFYQENNFPEGLLALHFNQLLAAVEDGDRRLIRNLMSQLEQRLSDLLPKSSLAREIAARLKQLFSAPVPGVELEAMESMLQICTPWGSIEQDSQLSKLKLPEPKLLARLEAADLALLLSIAAQREPEASEWRGISAVRRAFPEHRAMKPGALEDLRELLQADDLGRAYQLLIQHMRREEHSPASFAMLSIAAQELEDLGLPDRLRYVPGHPEERRLFLGVEFHERLAKALAQEGGCERLAQGQWDQLQALAEIWLERVSFRRERGGGRAEDVDQEATLSVWRARALGSRGEFLAALEGLRPSLGRARRQAFSDPYLSTLLLREAADLAEREGLPEALEMNQAVLEVAFPNGEYSVEGMARWLDGVAEEGSPLRIAVLLDTLIAQARLGEQTQREAREFLALARVHLPGEIYARLKMKLELVKAMRGDTTAALRALEAALSLSCPLGICLAHFHRALGLFREPEQRGHAFRSLNEAVRAARRAPMGAIRRAVENFSALAHFERAEGRDREQAEVHFRQAAEVAEGPSFPSGGLPLDLMLPKELSCLEESLHLLISKGEVALAQRLGQGGRRQRALRIDGTGRLGQDLKAQHRRWFHERWLQGDPQGLEALWEALPQEPAMERLQRTLEQGEAQLEFRLFEDWSAFFLLSPQATRIQTSNYGLRALNVEIDLLKEALQQGNDELLSQQIELLEHILIRSFEAELSGIKRLYISPDGPLFHLPFALLGKGHSLGAQFELAINQPAPSLNISKESASATALMVGDGLTRRELRLASYVGDGLFEVVEARLGADLEPEQLYESFSRARVVQLVGEIQPGPVIALSDHLPPLPLQALAEALAEGGVVCLSLNAPEDEALQAEALSILLQGLKGGIYLRRWQSDEAGDFLMHLLSESASAEDSLGLIEALSRVRRAAIERQVPPEEWSAYELYIFDS